MFHDDFTVFSLKSLVSLHLKQLNQECFVIRIIGVDFGGYAAVCTILDSCSSFFSPFSHFISRIVITGKCMLGLKSATEGSNKYLIPLHQKNGMDVCSTWVNMTRAFFPMP